MVEIVGRSRALIRALAVADRFAPTPLPILLVGATGTGKELFAQHIHEVSGRRGPLVPVNCAALPRDMVESLLFGHRRGAFTGAVEAVVGYVEAAEEGTLFLDELSSLPAEAQVKLLRVLETKEVNRLGETQSRRVDFRVVAAVQQHVRAQVAAGVLRLDLYQRVAGVVVELPRLGSVRRTFCRWPSTSRGLRGAPSSPGPWRCCSGTDGRATSGSFAVRSSERVFYQRAGPLRPAHLRRQSRSGRLARARPPPPSPTG